MVVLTAPGLGLRVNRSSSKTMSMNQTFIIRDPSKDLTESENSVFSDDSLLRTGNSTRSLLTPLYASDYESLSPKSLSEDQLPSDGESSCENIEDWNKGKKNKVPHKPLKTSKQKIIVPKSKQAWVNIEPIKGRTPQKSKRCNEIKAKDNHDHKSTSWEEWVVTKTLDDLKKLKMEKEKEKRKKTEIEDNENAKKRKEILAEEKRKEWLEVKNFELEKDRKSKAAQKQYEKLKRQQIKEIAEDKSKEKYSQWADNKKVKDQEAKDRKKQEIIKAAEKQIEKEKLNKEAFETWLVKSRLRNNGEHTSVSTTRYNNRISGASPGYVNPVPWIDPSVHRLSYTRKFRENMVYQSPPLLWKDYDIRISDMRKHVNGKRDYTVTRTTSKPYKAKTWR